MSKNTSRNTTAPETAPETAPTDAAPTAPAPETAPTAPTASEYIAAHASKVTDDETRKLWNRWARPAPPEGTTFGAQSGTYTYKGIGYDWTTDAAGSMFKIHGTDKRPALYATSPQACVGICVILGNPDAAPNTTRKDGRGELGIAPGRGPIPSGGGRSKSKGVNVTAFLLAAMGEEGRAAALAAAGDKDKVREYLAAQDGETNEPTARNVSLALKATIEAIHAADAAAASVTASIAKGADPIAVARAAMSAAGMTSEMINAALAGFVPPAAPAE